MSMDYLTSFGDPVRGDPEHIIFSSQAYKSEINVSASICQWITSLRSVILFGGTPNI
jgi:hypothetical protein